jgi:hypothetical protein
LTFLLFIGSTYYHLTVGCPGDENCKGCNSRYSDNTLYTFGCLRRPEELRKARCWLSAGTAKRSYNPSGTRTLDFIDEYISRSTRSSERVPLQVRFCMSKSGSWNNLVAPKKAKQASHPLKRHIDYRLNGALSNPESVG